MPTYNEVIIKGDKAEARAYLEGFFEGRRIRDGFAFSDDHPLDLDNLKELVKYHGSVLHVICTSRVLTAVKSAIKAAPESREFEIVETHRLRRAYYHFKFSTANRKVAGEIKRIVRKLPSGVRVIDYDEDEIVDPDARGTERYTPVHEYEFKGNGVVEGNPEGVFAVYRKMRHHDFFHIEHAVLHRVD